MTSQERRSWLGTLGLVSAGAAVASGAILFYHAWQEVKAKKREEGSLQKKEIVLAGRDHAVGTEEHGKHQRLVTQDAIVEKYVQQTAETKALQRRLMRLELQVLARENFTKWNEALQTKDPLKVARMYSRSDLSFLPTVSPKHIKGLEATEYYFEKFVLKNPFGTITDDQVQVYNNGDAYLHSGMYTFELGSTGTRTELSARFSYMWVKEGGEWKICHHHSSVTPEDKPTPPEDHPTSWRSLLIRSKSQTQLFEQNH